MATSPFSARALGQAAEARVAARYERAGFAVERNWRCRLGEIDLVCRRGTLVVFCEVKARSGDRAGSPLESVTPAKQRQLQRLARAYLAGGAEWAAVRFDVVGIGPDGLLEVVEGAF